VTTGAHAIIHAIGALVQHGTGMVRMSELLRLHTPVRRLGVLVGPALARDLAERRPAALVVASPYAEVVVAAQKALSTPPTLRVYGSKDLVGAEIASALAGAFTLGLGMADTLAFGPGPRALLITRAMAEGARLLVAAGGHARTMAGLAGLGNVLARSSPGAAEHSDDYQLGARLVKAGAGQGTSEGLRTLPSLLGLADGLGVRMPILRALSGSAVEGVPIAQAVTRLLEHHADEE
jgi:glycerol-3-phosphate dehydrogenase (NAD(P)+)